MLCLQLKVAQFHPHPEGTRLVAVTLGSCFNLSLFRQLALSLGRDSQREEGLCSLSVAALTLVWYMALQSRSWLLSVLHPLDPLVLVLDRREGPARVL